MERSESGGYFSPQTEEEIRRTARFRLLMAGIRDNDPVTKRITLENYEHEYGSDVADLFYMRALYKIMSEPNFTLTQWDKD